MVFYKPRQPQHDPVYWMDGWLDGWATTGVLQAASSQQGCTWAAYMQDYDQTCQEQLV